MQNCKTLKHCKCRSKHTCSRLKSVSTRRRSDCNLCFIWASWSKSSVPKQQQTHYRTVMYQCLTYTWRYDHYLHFYPFIFGSPQIYGTPIPKFNAAWKNSLPKTYYVSLTHSLTHSLTLTSKSQICSFPFSSSPKWQNFTSLPVYTISHQLISKLCRTASNRLSNYTHCSFSVLTLEASSQ